MSAQIRAKKNRLGTRILIAIAAASSLTISFLIGPSPKLTPAAQASTFTDTAILRLDGTNSSSYSGSGTTWANLKSGTIGNATLVNGTDFNSRSKLFNFDGTNDYVSVPTFTSDFSQGISAHVVADFGLTNETWERLFDFGTGEDQVNIFFGRNFTSSNLRVGVHAAGSGNDYSCDTTNGPIVYGMAVYSFTISPAGVCKIYVNHVEATTQILAGSNLTLPNTAFTRNYIGESNWAADAFFKGSIQSVIVYNQVKAVPECVPVESNFTGTGVSDITSTTYGTSGIRYKQVEFYTTGKCTWTTPTGVSSADLILVGGGGGGGYGSRAGGGGAGEVAYKTGYAVTAGSNIELKIGFGGAAAYHAANGDSTLFGSIVALGGGRGAGDAGAASTGGSSGGGYGVINASPVAATSSSNTGFTHLVNSGGGSDGTSWGAGGGGAGGAAARATDYAVDSSQPDGGNSITLLGHELAGGGGGWMGGSFTSSGGGTVGGSWNTAGSTPGAMNTGSGGGSNSAGGSGVVIFRYQLPKLSSPNSFTSSQVSGARKTLSTSWTSVPGAEGYEIDIYDENDTFLSTVSVSSGTSKLITSSDFAGIADDTTYKLYIKAIGDAVDETDSEFSSVSQIATYPEVTVSINQDYFRKYSRRSIIFTFTFSETVTGFTASDVTLTGTGWSKGTVTGSGTTYELIVTNSNPTVDENVSVSVGVSGVSSSTTSVVGPSTSTGGTKSYSRPNQISKWMKFLYGEELEKF